MYLFFHQSWEGWHFMLAQGTWSKRDASCTRKLQLEEHWGQRPAAASCCLLLPPGKGIRTSPSAVWAPRISRIPAPSRKEPGGSGQCLAPWAPLLLEYQHKTWPVPLDAVATSVPWIKQSGDILWLQSIIQVYALTFPPIPLYLKIKWSCPSDILGTVSGLC